MDPPPAGGRRSRDVRMGHPILAASSSTGQGQRRRNSHPYLAVSAPFVIKVLISSSWPYLAATWRGVLPYLSAQSISLPAKEMPSGALLHPHTGAHSNPFSPLLQEGMLEAWRCPAEGGVPSLQHCCLPGCDPAGMSAPWVCTWLPLRAHREHRATSPAGTGW